MVDPARIAVIGSSFGGGVAAYAGGVDTRITAVISNGGWGDSENTQQNSGRSCYLQRGQCDDARSNATTCQVPQ